jgi:ADP-heptose:LPS heptosyltransferase
MQAELPGPDMQIPDPSLISYTPQFDPFEPGLLSRLPELPRRVVLLRASRIGDFINATPAFHALKRHMPEAEISVITLPMLSDLSERCSAVDRTLIFPGYPGLADQFFDARRALAFFAQMQAENFDLAIQIQGTGVNSNPFMLMLGARYTAGFVRPGDPAGRLAAALPWPETGHEMERCLALTEFLGAPTPPDLLPEFGLRVQDHAEAQHWLERADPPWIGIHTSARDATRRWPIERFAQAAAALQARHGGTVLFIGEERDRVDGDQALQAAGAPYLNLAGSTSIPVTGAILQRLSIFLTNDTGPAHIAYAVRAPVVTIFGGGDPARNGPLTAGPHRILAHPIDCRPCETGDCPIGLRCLDQISVEKVVQAAEEIFTFGGSY